MSTTFGVRVKSETGVELVKVAFRTFTIEWTNPIAHLLENNTPVIAMDNSQQGIHTIGDIKDKMEKQSKEE